MLVPGLRPRDNDHISSLFMYYHHLSTFNKKVFKRTVGNVDRKESEVVRLHFLVSSRDLHTILKSHMVAYTALSASYRCKHLDLPYLHSG
jgi:hypothetical protein